MVVFETPSFVAVTSGVLYDFSCTGSHSGKPAGKFCHATSLPGM